MSSGDAGPLITADEVRAVIKTDLGDGAIEDIVDRESAWLARRIGALSGERTQTMWLRDVDRDDPLILQRPTDAVTVTDDVTELEPAQVRLLGSGWVVERADAPWTGPSVSVVYTPNDEDEVIRVLLELIRLSTTETGYQSERIGEYSYTRAPGNATLATSAARDILVRDLLPKPGIGTIRMRSSVLSDRIGAFS